MDNIAGKKLTEKILGLIGEFETLLSEEINHGLKEKLQLKIQDIRLTATQCCNNHSKKLTETETALEIIEKELKAESENRSNLFGLINNYDGWMWSVDVGMNMVAGNEAFIRDYKNNYGLQLIKGLNVTTSLPEPFKTNWQQRYKRALSGERFYVSDRYGNNSTSRFIETFVCPIYSQGQLTGVSCIARDITRQKVSEEKFNILSDLMPGAISIQSGNTFLYFNKAWAKLTGYPPDMLREMPFLTLFDDESKEIVDLHLLKNQFNNTDARRANVLLTTKTNEKLWLEMSVVDISYNDTEATLAVASDITTIYNLHADLKQSRANLISQIENTDARIWAIDSELRIITINNNYKNDYRKAFGVLLQPGDYCLKNATSEIVEIWEGRYRMALKGKQFTKIDEFGLNNLNLYTETSFNPVIVDGRVAGVSCFSRDITSQKQYEKALEESESKFKALVSNIPGIVYRCANNKEWTMAFISDEVEKLTGYPPSDFINNKVRSFADIIHPDDRHFVNLTINESIGNSGKFELSYRLVHANQGIKWVHETGRAHSNKKGEIDWLDGVIIDITENKIAEEALVASEEKYRAVFNSINDIVIRTDFNGTILLVTPSIYDNLGYTPEEVIGKSILLLYADAAQRQKLIHLIIEKDVVRDYEAGLIDKSGNIKTVSLNARLIRNSEGKPDGIESVARDITMRKVAEQLLQERTLELNSIFENAPMTLMLINEQGKVLNINRAGTYTPGNNNKSRDFNAALGELLNCINSISKPEGCGKGKYCANCVLRNTINQTFIKKQDQRQVEGALKVMADNREKTVYYQISTTFIVFGKERRVLLSLDDITEIKKAQEQLRKLSTAFDQTTATIVITDINGKIQYVNPQFVKTTGYTADEVLGKNPRILKSENTTFDEYKNLWKTILSGNTWHGEFLNVRKDKTEYWENAIISPVFDENGAIDSFIAIKENITEKKKIQQELMDSERELRQMNEEKSRYFSILAHDLRGMVGSYHAFSDLLVTHFDTFDPDDLKEQLNNLVKSSGDSLSLLDNLLEWARTSLGKTALSLVALNLNEEIDIVLNLLKEVAATKQIELINSNKKNIVVNTDAHVLQTIMRNLVNNAIKFTPRNGKIYVFAKMASASEVEISVEDTGIGMDEETVRKLFKPGEKVVKEGTNQEKGTGLGLMICDEMIKRLGGKIAVESSPGKGSRFYFIIPVK
ncbi:MAG: PAS domain S-box protein [Bacteroidales bacterium]|nr:PAS domain S-box protein [Bacteroidales bacterium]